MTLPLPVKQEIIHSHVKKNTTRKYIGYEIAIKGGEAMDTKHTTVYRNVLLKY